MEQVESKKKKCDKCLLCNTQSVWSQKSIKTIFKGMFIIESIIQSIDSKYHNTLLEYKVRNKTPFTSLYHIKTRKLLVLNQSEQKWQQIDQNELLNSFYSRSRNAFILGKSGIGKTALLKSLSYRWANNQKDIQGKGKEQIKPFYLVYPKKKNLENGQNHQNKQINYKTCFIKYILQALKRSINQLKGVYPHIRKQLIQSIRREHKMISRQIQKFQKLSQDYKKQTKIQLNLLKENKEYLEFIQKLQQGKQWKNKNKQDIQKYLKKNEKYMQQLLKLKQIKQWNSRQYMFKENLQYFKQLQSLKSLQQQQSNQNILKNNKEYFKQLLQLEQINQWNSKQNQLKFIGKTEHILCPQHLESGFKQYLFLFDDYEYSGYQQENNQQNTTNGSKYILNTFRHVINVRNLEQLSIIKDNNNFTFQKQYVLYKLKQLEDTQIKQMIKQNLKIILKNQQNINSINKSNLLDDLNSQKLLFIKQVTDYYFKSSQNFKKRKIMMQNYQQSRYQNLFKQFCKQQFDQYYIIHMMLNKKFLSYYKKIQASEPTKIIQFHKQFKGNFNGLIQNQHQLFQKQKKCFQTLYQQMNKLKQNTNISKINYQKCQQFLKIGIVHSQPICQQLNRDNHNQFILLNKYFQMFIYAQMAFLKYYQNAQKNRIEYIITLLFKNIQHDKKNEQMNQKILDYFRVFFLYRINFGLSKINNGEKNLLEYYQFKMIFKYWYKKDKKEQFNQFLKDYQDIFKKLMLFMDNYIQKYLKNIEKGQKWEFLNKFFQKQFIQLQTKNYALNYYRKSFIQIFSQSIFDPKKTRPLLVNIFYKCYQWIADFYEKNKQMIDDLLAKNTIVNRILKIQYIQISYKILKQVVLLILKIRNESKKKKIQQLKQQLFKQKGEKYLKEYTQEVLESLLKNKKYLQYIEKKKNKEQKTLFKSSFYEDKFYKELGLKQAKQFCTIMQSQPDKISNLKYQNKVDCIRSDYFLPIMMANLSTRFYLEQTKIDYQN